MATLMESILLIFIVWDALQMTGFFQPHDNSSGTSGYINAAVSVVAIVAGMMCTRYSCGYLRNMLVRLILLTAFIVFIGAMPDMEFTGPRIVQAVQITLVIGMLLLMATLADRYHYFEQDNKTRDGRQHDAMRFLAVASHDLRQPMHALNIYLASLVNVELPEAAKPILSKICQCADTMDDMFLALLDLSRLDAQMVQPGIKDFSIDSVLARMDIEFSPQAQAKGLEFSIVPCRVWVESDPALVEQMLRNLIANAVRYTAAGRIEIGCHVDQGRLHIAVKDTGMGISRQQQKMIFDEFFQADNPSRERGQGLGLGLAIVRRICGLLDAAVTLASTPGVGSTFTLDLPLQRNPAEALALVCKPAANDRGAMENKLIAVIDADHSVRHATQALLEQHGCTVVAAASGSEAIAAMKSVNRSPDAILCDDRVGPNETGLDVIDRFHRQFSDGIPAVLMTSDTGHAAEERLASSGYIVVQKPVHAARFIEVLTCLLH